MNRILPINALVLLMAILRADAQPGWLHLSGPEAGNVTAIIASSTSDIFAGTADRGLLTSTDGGTHWKSLPLYGGRIISVVRTGAASLYAATEFGPVWRSTDGGASWKSASGGIEGKALAHLAANSAGYLFAATQQGVYRSIDNGAHWYAINTGMGAVRIMQIAISVDDHLFVATYRNGVFRSYDNGDSWLAINTTLTSTKARTITVDKFRMVYLGCESDGIFTTADDGDSWRRVLSGGSFTYLGFDNISNLIALDDQGILTRSTDNGLHWSTLSGDNISFRVSAFAFDENGTLFGGTPGMGMFKSTNGVNGWTRIGFPTGSVAELLALPDGRVAAATLNGYVRDGGVQYSDDNGTSWIRPGLGNIIPRSLTRADDGSTLCVTAAAAYHGDAGGANWTQISFGVPPGELTCGVLAANGDLLAGTSRNGVYRYSISGARWIFEGCESLYVNTMLRTTSGSIFAGTTKGLFAASSEDAWNSTPASGISGTVTALAQGNGYLLAGTDSGVFRSTDNGEHWLRSQHDLADGHPEQVLSLSEIHEPVVFAGSPRGMYRSTDAGEHWSAVGGSLDTLAVTAIAFSTHNIVFAGTASDGIFVTDGVVNSVRAEGGTRELPNRLLLLGNYPNPFNPLTSIRFSVPRATHVRVDVFSPLGELIATVYDGMTQSGSHEVSWNGEGNASGLYIARIQSAGEAAVQKMLLMK